MRRVSWIVMTAAAGAVAVGACGDSDERTSGPIQSIVHAYPDRVLLYAVKHRLDLASLPIGEKIGLPVSGTVELDAKVTIPLRGFEPDYPAAHGKLAVRCVAHCRIGDDVARLQMQDALGVAPDGVPFSHLDLDQLDVRVTIADGHARVTHFALGSPDLDLDVQLDVALDRDPGESRIDGCLRVRPSDALQRRDPTLASMVSLIAPLRNPDGSAEIGLEGSASDPRAYTRSCANPAP